ncbi:GAF domain-containing protein [uncultured Paenibacillus sp.]|uniref:GAF domain-containing protein n=1 Tax=uncultured Paenibacillus sp. TaxID=227322 RepID=UPI0015ACF254|nr:GAF domain-containing protein [uncultured Paenibacillus sp.]
MNPTSSCYQVIIDQLREQMGYDFVSLAFAESAVNDFVLTWKYASGNLNDRYKRIVLQSGKGIAGIVFKTGNAMLVASVADGLAPQEMYNYPILISERLTSLAAIPLYMADRVEGVLLAGYRGEKRMSQEGLNELYKWLQGRFGDFEIKELNP